MYFRTLAALAASLHVVQGLRELSQIPAEPSASLPESYNDWLRRTCEHHTWTALWENYDFHVGLGDGGDDSDDDDGLSAFEEDVDDYEDGEDWSTVSSAASTSSTSEIKATFRSDGGSRMWSIVRVDSQKVDFDLSEFHEDGVVHGFRGVAELTEGAALFSFVPRSSGRVEVEIERDGQRSRLEMLRDEQELTRMHPTQLLESLNGTTWNCDAQQWFFTFLPGGHVEVGHAGHIERVSLDPVQDGDSALFGHGVAWILEWPSVEPRPYLGATFEFSQVWGSPRIVIDIRFGRQGHEALLMSRMDIAPAA
mmetsp:Transcript_81588/g.228836  ORF Transcript_81588/g.228836 Transcript_81588/m.228836 type:complete len:309 (-) Transcript_81588:23-949(-)